MSMSLTAHLLLINCLINQCLLAYNLLDATHYFFLWQSKANPNTGPVKVSLASLVLQVLLILSFAMIWVNDAEFIHHRLMLKRKR